MIDLTLTTIDNEGKQERNVLLTQDYFNFMPLFNSDCIIAINYTPYTVDILIKKEQAPKYVTLTGEFLVDFYNNKYNFNESTKILWERD